jgi:hypothetical protein
MSVSEESEKRIKEARKMSADALAEVSMKTETAVKEAKKVEEYAIESSQDALKKAEGVRRSTEHTLEVALVKVEENMRVAAEETIPKIVARKLVQSRQFGVYSILVLFVLITIAICISVGLSYLVK